MAHFAFVSTYSLRKCFTFQTLELVCVMPSQILLSEKHLNGSDQVGIVKNSANFFPNPVDFPTHGLCEVQSPPDGCKHKCVREQTRDSGRRQVRLAVFINYFLLAALAVQLFHTFSAFTGTSCRLKRLADTLVPAQAQTPHLVFALCPAVAAIFHPLPTDQLAEGRYVSTPLSHTYSEDSIH